MCEPLKWDFYHEGKKNLYIFIYIYITVYVSFLLCSISGMKKKPRKNVYLIGEIQMGDLSVDIDCVWGHVWQRSSVYMHGWTQMGVVAPWCGIAQGPASRTRSLTYMRSRQMCLWSNTCFSWMTESELGWSTTGKSLVAASTLDACCFGWIQKTTWTIFMYFFPAVSVETELLDRGGQASHKLIRYKAIFTRNYRKQNCEISYSSRPALPSHP